MTRFIALVFLLLASPAVAQIAPAPSPMTGNAFAGRCNPDGTVDILPSANWACSRQNATPGNYRVTVPAGYNARDYAIVVSISGNWKGAIQAYAPDATYFLVTIFDQVGASMDAGFGFVVTRNATIYP